MSNQIIACAGHQSVKLERFCIICGKRFEIFPSALTRTRGKYCGLQCTGVGKRRPLIERFWENVWKTDNCWLWTGAMQKYGIIQQSAAEGGKRRLYAHRVSWVIHHGPIPVGANVLHRCDNTICVRPDDLFLGTTQDNSADMCAKGRQCKGEKCHSARLTAEQVLFIRQGQFTQREIMERFGISQSNASSILRGETWKHL